MHDGMQYDPIQGQSHEPFRVGNPAVFKSYLCYVTLNLAETSVAKSRPSVPHEANLFIIHPTRERGLGTRQSRCKALWIVCLHPMLLYGLRCQLLASVAVRCYW